MSSGKKQSIALKEEGNIVLNDDDMNELEKLASATKGLDSKVKKAGYTAVLNDVLHRTETAVAMQKESQTYMQNTVKWLGGIVVVIALLLLANFAMTISAIEMSKESHVKSGTLTDTAGKVVQVGSSDFSLASGGQMLQRKSTSTGQSGPKLADQPDGNAIGTAPVLTKYKLSSRTPNKYLEELDSITVATPCAKDATPAECNSKPTMKATVKSFKRRPSEGSHCGSVVVFQTDMGEYILDDDVLFQGTTKMRADGLFSINNDQATVNVSAEGRRLMEEGAAPAVDANIHGAFKFLGNVNADEFDCQMGGVITETFKVRPPTPPEIPHSYIVQKESTCFVADKEGGACDSQLIQGLKPGVTKHANSTTMRSYEQVLLTETHRIVVSYFASQPLSRLILITHLATQVNTQYINFRKGRAKLSCVVKPVEGATTVTGNTDVHLAYLSTITDEGRESMRWALSPYDDKGAVIPLYTEYWERVRTRMPRRVFLRGDTVIAPGVSADLGVTPQEFVEFSAGMTDDEVAQWVKSILFEDLGSAVQCPEKEPVGAMPSYLGPFGEASAAWIAQQLQADDLEGFGPGVVWQGSYYKYWSVMVATLGTPTINSAGGRRLSSKDRTSRKLAEEGAHRRRQNSMGKVEPDEDAGGEPAEAPGYPQIGADMGEFMGCIETVKDCFGPGSVAGGCAAMMLNALAGLGCKKDKTDKDGCEDDNFAITVTCGPCSITITNDLPSFACIFKGGTGCYWKSDGAAVNMSPLKGPWQKWRMERHDCGIHVGKEVMFTLPSKHTDLCAKSGGSNVKYSGTMCAHNRVQWNAVTNLDPSGTKDCGPWTRVPGCFDSSCLSVIDLVAELQAYDVKTVVDPRSGMNFGDHKIAKTEGMSVWNLKSKFMKVTGSGGLGWAVAQEYSQCFQLMWRSSDKGWRTLFNGAKGISIIVQSGTKRLGMYSRDPDLGKNHKFRDSGYDIDVNQWNVVCVVGKGRSEKADDYHGTQDFYVATLSAPTLTKVGSVDRAISMSTATGIGQKGQGPGELAFFTHWNYAAPLEAMQPVATELLERTKVVRKLPVLDLVAANHITDIVDPNSLTDWGSKEVKGFKGTRVWDLDNSYLQVRGSEGKWKVAKKYTQCYQIYWRQSDKNWRTLFRGSSDHAVIVEKSGRIGMYSNRNGRWRKANKNRRLSGAVAGTAAEQRMVQRRRTPRRRTPSPTPAGDLNINKNQWTVLCMYGEGRTGTSWQGKQTFYVATENGGDHTLKKIGVSDRAVSGTTVRRIGWPGQGPGKLAMVKHWNYKVPFETLQTMATAALTAAVADAIMADTTWDLVAENQVGQTTRSAGFSGDSRGVKFGKQNVTWAEGVVSWDLDNDYLQVSSWNSGPDAQLRVASVYTQCYHIKWRAEDFYDREAKRCSGKPRQACMQDRTLFRTLGDGRSHLRNVDVSAMVRGRCIGVWRRHLRQSELTQWESDCDTKYRNQKALCDYHKPHFRAAGCDIDITAWSAVCVVGREEKIKEYGWADHYTTYGKSEFYVATVDKPTLRLVGTADGVVTGELLDRIGADRQGPGKLGAWKHWNFALDLKEMQTFANERLQGEPDPVPNLPEGFGQSPWKDDWFGRCGLGPKKFAALPTDCSECPSVIKYTVKDLPGSVQNSLCSRTTGEAIVFTGTGCGEKKIVWQNLKCGGSCIGKNCQRDRTDAVEPPPEPSKPAVLDLVAADQKGNQVADTKNKIYFGKKAVTSHDGFPVWDLDDDFLQIDNHATGGQVNIRVGFNYTQCYQIKWRQKDWPSWPKSCGNVPRQTCAVDRSLFRGGNDDVAISLRGTCLQVWRKHVRQSEQTDYDNKKNRNYASYSPGGKEYMKPNNRGCGRLSEQAKSEWNFVCAVGAEKRLYENGWGRDWRTYGTTDFYVATESQPTLRNVGSADGVVTDNPLYWSNIGGPPVGHGSRDNWAGKGPGKLALFKYWNYQVEMEALQAMASNILEPEALAAAAADEAARVLETAKWLGTCGTTATELGSSLPAECTELDRENTEWEGPSEGRVTLQADSNDKYLSDAGGVLSVADKPSSSAKWQLQKTGHKYFIVSDQGKTLKDHVGVVELSDRFTGDEKWKKEGAGGGKYYFKSHRGFWLSSPKGSFGCKLCIMLINEDTGKTLGVKVTVCGGFSDGCWFYLEIIGERVPPPSWANTVGVMVIVTGYLKICMMPLSIMGWIMLKVTKGFCTYVLGFAVAYAIYGGLKFQMAWDLASGAITLTGSAFIGIGGGIYAAGSFLDEAMDSLFSVGGRRRRRRRRRRHLCRCGRADDKGAIKSCPRRAGASGQFTFTVKMWPVKAGEDAQLTGTLSFAISLSLFGIDISLPKIPDISLFKTNVRRPFDWTA